MGGSKTTDILFKEKVKKHAFTPLEINTDEIGNEKRQITKGGRMVSLSHSVKKKSLTGFTLIELLIVIAIVGIIAAILMPALGKAREGARRAQCANSLRQIGIAFYIYLDEHGEEFPKGGGSSSPSQANRAWEKYLYPSYIDNNDVFTCHAPEVVGDYRQGDVREVILKDNYYGYNGCLSMKYLSDVSKASRTILCADASRRALGTMSIMVMSSDFSFSDRHSSGANVLFISGGVKWFPRDVIEKNVGGDDGGWWGWPAGRGRRLPITPLVPR